MIKIVTANVNGIRSAAKKGFFEWLQSVQPDIICLQEVRAPESVLTDPIYHPTGYIYQHVEAKKPGYSGVSMYAKQTPVAIQTSMNFPVADQEGRYLHFEFDTYIVLSVYFPSGGSGDHRQAIKYEFLDHMFLHCQDLAKKTKKSLILCGDVNIAHTKDDLKNWKANQKESGFLPEERAWLDKLFGELGMVDAFRVLNQNTDEYTWWSNFGRAWANNVGWRIDYQIVTPDLRDKIKHVEIYRDNRYSDHAPVIIEYDLS